LTFFFYFFFFLRGQELREALKSVPELQTVVGEAESKAVLEAAGSGAEAERGAFEAAFKGLMTEIPEWWPTAWPSLLPGWRQRNP